MTVADISGSKCLLLLVRPYMERLIRLETCTEADTQRHQNSWALCSQGFH